VRARLSLAELVDRALDRHNVRYGAELERIAEKHGHRLHVTTINAIRAGSYPHKPTKATIEALAFLAGVPARVVFEAAGLPTPGPPLIKDLPEDADNLDSVGRELVRKLVRVLLDRQYAAQRFPSADMSHDREVSELRRSDLPSSGSQVTARSQ
jgi:hypothetical protein